MLFVIKSIINADANLHSPAQEMSDFKQERFPKATEVHWKVLLREINLSKTTSPRRLAAKFPSLASLKKYVGLEIKHDKSIVALGK